MSATTILLNWALSQYENISQDEPVNEWITPDNVKHFALQEAENWLTCEPGYDGEDDEMFPAFVPLVSNTAILPTIDWDGIAQAVIQMKDKQDGWVCDGCGDNEMEELTTCEGKALCPCCEAKTSI